MRACWALAAPTGGAGGSGGSRRGASPTVERACWAGNARGRGPLRRWGGADRAGLGRKEVGRGFRLVGPSAGKGEGVGLGPVVGFLGRVSVGFGFAFLFSISNPFLFLIQTKFEFKYKFELKPHSNH